MRRFYVRNRACVVFFCKTTERTGSVTETPPTQIRAVADIYQCPHCQRFLYFEDAILE